MSSLPRSVTSSFGFSSPAPKVRLIHAFDRPYENVVATARTCYSAKGIVTEDQASAKPDRRDAIAKSIYEAGHHTTFQHAHFQFSLENVSRQFLWTFLHSHPFYNSEQVSQRYVEVKKGNYAVPPMPPAERELYERTARRQQDAYARLTELLTPLAAERYFGLFPGRTAGRRTRPLRRRDPEARAGDRALRAAGRDLLVPVPHDLGRDALPLLAAVRVDGRPGRAARGHRTDGRGGPAPRSRSTPTVLQDPLPLEETPEYAAFAALPRVRPGRARVSRGVRPRARGPRLAPGGLEGQQRAGPGVGRARGPGRLARRALRRRRDPHGPRSVAQPDPGRDADPDHARQALARALPPVVHVPQEALAHGRQPGPAPPDDARRRARRSRPTSPTSPTTSSRCSCPRSRRPTRSTARPWRRPGRAIGELRERGVSDEFAAYLLPNAVAIRFTESADLLNLHHKFAMRLCYNAQEEIWRASLDEALQIREVNPRIGPWLLPPCTLRHLAEVRPVCPGGRALLRRGGLEEGPNRVHASSLMLIPQAGPRRRERLPGEDSGPDDPWRSRASGSR